MLLLLHAKVRGLICGAVHHAHGRARVANVLWECVFVAVIIEIQFTIWSPRTCGIARLVVRCVDAGAAEFTRHGIGAAGRGHVSIRGRGEALY